MKRLLWCVAVLALAVPGWSRYMVVFRLASPPLPVEAGQHFSLCAANVGTVKADVTMQFLDVRTGAVIASRDAILPPPGSGVAPDPCLETTAEQVTGGGDPPLLVALLVIRHGVFSRAAAATASVQVTTADHRLLASIPLHLATLVRGRNTPIERQ